MTPAIILDARAIVAAKPRANPLEAIARERFDARRLVEGISARQWFALPYKQRARICEIGCAPWFANAAPLDLRGFDPARVHPDDPCQSKGKSS